MLGKNEVVLLAMNEKRGNVCIFYVIYRVKLLDTKVMLSNVKSTFYLIVDFMKDNAIPLNIDSFPPCLSANSLESFYKFEKGESRTTHPISWLVSAYIRAVTAPMLLPQMPMLLTV
jgi:hypothetical protein